MKPYKEGTPLNVIINDGFSRGFNAKQTVKEAKEMGYDVTIEYVRDEWIKMNNAMLSQMGLY